VYPELTVDALLVATEWTTDDVEVINYVAVDKLVVNPVAIIDLVKSITPPESLLSSIFYLLTFSSISCAHVCSKNCFSNS